MRGLFVRIYVALVAVILAGFGAAGAWDHARRHPPPMPALEALHEAPDDIREAFETLGPERARRRLSKQLEADIRVIPAAAPLPPDVREELRAGHVVYPRMGRPLDLWVPLPEAVVHVVPRHPRPPPLPWIVGAVLVGLGATIGLLLWPLQRDLRTLGDAARRFGVGEHDVRAEVRPTAATAALAHQFNEMVARIGGLVEGQRELLLAVSHELRTPLNRLRFAVELLADEADPSARGDQSEAVQRDLDELDRLVTDLLAWGRLGEAPAVSHERIELEPLVRSLLEDAERGRPGLQVEHRVAATEVVSADPADLRRALSNVVHNAARHASGRVRVTVERADGRCRIVVDDDGPGIPVAQREQVLQPFVRLDDARSRDAGGAGLGLALASRVAQAHGGGIDIEDAPSGGARVVLWLPEVALTMADVP